VGGQPPAPTRHFDGIDLLDIFNEDGVVLAAKGAAPIVALLLGGSELAVQTASQVNQFGEVVEVRFRVVGVGELLQKDLGEAGGGGLETDFRQFGGIVAAEKIEEVILIQAVVEHSLLFETPFDVTTCSPIGYVAFDEGEAGIVEGGDNIFVGKAVPEHVIDHVALDFGK
jgi:hypothetical protein